MYELSTNNADRGVKLIKVYCDVCLCEMTDDKGVHIQIAKRTEYKLRHNMVMCTYCYTKIMGPLIPANVTWEMGDKE